VYVVVDVVGTLVVECGSREQPARLTIRMQIIRINDTALDLLIPQTLYRLALEFHSADVLIEDQSERNLALYLMLFGRWHSSDPKPIILNGNELDAMEITAVPDSQTSGLEPFSFIGELSGWFRCTTTS